MCFWAKIARLTLTTACFTAAMAATADTVQANNAADIQTLIDSATGARTILLPAGNVSMPTGLRLKSNITLDGQNQSVLNFPTNLAMPAVAAYGTASTVGTVSGIDVQFRTLTMPATTSLAQGEMLYIDANNGVDGYANQVSETDTGTTFVLDHDNAMYTNGMTVKRVTPVENIVIKNFRLNGGNNAFWFQYGRNIQISNLVMANTALNSVVQGSLGVSVSNCILDGCGGGYSFISSTDVSVAKNTVVKHRMSGFFLRSVVRGDVRGNIVSGVPNAPAGTTGDGITLYGSYQVKVWDNDVRYPNSYAYQATNSIRCTFEKNWAVAAPIASYLVSACDQISLVKNVATTSTTGIGFAVSGSSFAYAAQNTAWQTKRGFFMSGNTRSGALTDNLSLGNQHPDYIN